MPTLFCADLSPAVAALALDQARRAAADGKYATALDRYATYMWLAKLLRKRSEDDQERAAMTRELADARSEREHIKRREARPQTGHGLRYRNWHIDGSHRQRLYVPSATGLYTTMHLTGTTAIEKDPRPDYTQSVQRNELYTKPSEAWEDSALFTSAGLTSLRAMDGVVLGVVRPEEAHAQSIRENTRGGK